MSDLETRLGAAAPTQHLYLSPHLDDAVLSCGGMIHAQAKQGERVSVLTICAGAPPPGPLSEYAYGLHERWGQARADAQRLAADMVEIRREEDRAALALLGADARFLNVPDVIYRRRVDGAWTVESDPALFRGFEAGEAELLASTTQAIGQEIDRLRAAGGSAAFRLYIPLAAGDHVDHHLVRRAAEDLFRQRPDSRASAYYFEDYPYAEDPKAVESALGERRNWAARTVALGKEDLEAKVASIACYRSQISSFWSDPTEMEAAVRRMAMRVAQSDSELSSGKAALAEGLWRPNVDSRA